jgi:hypothetical protein
MIYYVLQLNVASHSPFHPHRQLSPSSFLVIPTGTQQHHFQITFPNLHTTNRSCVIKLSSSCHQTARFSSHTSSKFWTRTSSQHDIASSICIPHSQTSSIFWFCYSGTYAFLYQFASSICVHHSHTPPDHKTS